jgi:hypothetical protein
VRPRQVEETGSRFFTNFRRSSVGRDSSSLVLGWEEDGEFFLGLIEEVSLVVRGLWYRMDRLPFMV